MPLFSSPGEVAVALAFESSAVASVEFSAGGPPAFDPDGRAASPDAFGTGVSAAKAVAPVISMAAKNKLGTLIIGFLLGGLNKRERQRRLTVPRTPAEASALAMLSVVSEIYRYP